jgi:hypothetical protein
MAVAVVGGFYLDWEVRPSEYAKPKNTRRKAPTRTAPYDDNAQKKHEPTFSDTHLFLCNSLSRATWKLRIILPARYSDISV